MNRPADIRNIGALVLVAALFWIAAGWAQDAYPPLTGRVVDVADVLAPDVEATLDQRLAEHERTTSNQVVVVTLPTLGERDIESYANDLFREWRLGQEGTDNGVLLLVAPNERAMRIEVGYGLEGVLTDAVAGDIVRNRILPRFRDGDLPAGVTAGVDAILAAIDGSYQAAPEQAETRDYLPLLIFAVWMVLVLYQGFRRRRRRSVFGGFGHYPPRGILMGGPGGRSGGGFGGGFRGGGGSSGGGGASGRW